MKLNMNIDVMEVWRRHQDLNFGEIHEAVMTAEIALSEALDDIIMRKIRNAAQNKRPDPLDQALNENDGVYRP